MANPKTPASAIIDFRERHRLDQAEVDRLFGFSSGGRACRRWEAVDAPYYVSVIMAYADEFGIKKMVKMAAQLESEPALQPSRAAHAASGKSPARVPRLARDKGPVRRSVSRMQRQPG